MMETQERGNELPEGGELQQPGGQSQERDALVIRVSSWATPIVGLVTLVIGLLSGYYIRPIVETETTLPTPTAVSTSPPAESSSTSGSSQTSADDREAQIQALMEAVVAQTRHFKGDPNAPVTLIEFSDFK